MVATPSMFFPLLALLEATSSGTPESRLAAIEAANALLKAKGKTWEAVLVGVFYKQDDPEELPEPYQKYTGDTVVDEMFKVVRSRSGNTFINSLYQQYHQKGWLSEKQREALQKFYDRC